MVIKKWIGNKKNYKLRRKKRGGVHMAVSMGIYPTIRGKDAERVLNTPPIPREFIKECAEVVNKYIEMVDDEE